MAGALAQRARPLRRFLWQHLSLDVLLLALAAYGYWAVSRQGRVVSGDRAGVLAGDPLLGLAPLLQVVACCLVAARLLPSLVADAARIAGRGPSAATTQALLTLARVPASRVRWMLLLALCVASGVFAAAVAGVVADNTRDRAHYDAGGPLRFEEIDDAHKVYSALPWAWHSALPGVQDATIVARFPAVLAG